MAVDDRTDGRRCLSLKQKNTLTRFRASSNDKMTKVIQSSSTQFRVTRLERVAPVKHQLQEPAL